MLDRRGFFKVIGGAAAAVAFAATHPVRFYREGLPTFSEIVTQTLRSRHGEVADNVMANNELFAALRDRGVIVSRET